MSAQSPADPSPAHEPCAFSGDLAAKVAFLRRPEAYPDAPAGVEAVQTHMSWVFLAGEHAWKLKKPVRTDFLDYSTADARRRSAEEELRLNRCLAPDVYLGVVPLAADPAGGFRLGGAGEAADWLVHMRRLPAARMLDAAMRSGTVTREDVLRFMAVLCGFYLTRERVDVAPQRYRERLAADTAGNEYALREKRYTIPAGAIAAAFTAQRRFLDRRGGALEARAAERRIVEGHGDLRPEHVYLGDPPSFIDCLEFNPEWRRVDPADEIAYLAMECEHAGARWVGDLALAEYRARLRDEPAAELVHFYKAYRAGLRAKLAVWHLDDHPAPAEREKWTARAASYLGLAARYASMLAM